MKKLLALVLAVLMVLSMAACQTKPVETTPPATQGGNDTPTQPKETEPAPKDPVTITYWYGGQGEMEDTQKVEDKLNEILKTIPGYEYITIDLRPTKSFAKNFVLAQSDKEQIDIVASFYLDPVALYNEGSILPLDDLIAQYPEVVSQIPDWMVEMGKIHGEQGYIPCAQQACNMYYWLYYKPTVEAYCKENFLTTEQFKELACSTNMKARLAFIEEYTLFARAFHGTDKIYASGPSEIGVWFSLEHIGENFGHWIIAEGEQEVSYYALRPETQLWLSTMARWYDEGLIHPDTTFKFDANKWGVEDSRVLNYTASVSSEEMVTNQAGNVKNNLIAFQMRENYYIPSQYAAGGTFIYSECAHPEEAMKILILLHTDIYGDEFYNTLCWGIEGKHYEWVDKENERIKTLEFDGAQGNSQCSYQAWKWQIGNSFNAWKNQAVSDGEYEYIESVHNDPNSVKSPAMGITWELDEIEDIISNCSAIKNEFAWTSIYALGEDGWKARYDEYITKLKVAGVDLALKELNDQLKEHLAKQAK